MLDTDLAGPWNGFLSGPRLADRVPAGWTDEPYTRFSLTPEAGAAWVGANLRLGESTDVRVVAEMSDGKLVAARRHVKVTVGGCGG